MGLIFFLAGMWSKYAGIWAYEPGRLFLKGQKPENRWRSYGFGGGSLLYRFLASFRHTLATLQFASDSKMLDVSYYTIYYTLS